MGLSFSEGVHAPWLQLPDRETILMSHNALKAHGRAVQELRAHARQPLVIGYAPTSGIALPATDKPEDIEAAWQAYFGIPQEGTWAWNTAWWSDPVIFGKYPEEFLVHFEKDLPKITFQIPEATYLAWVDMNAYLGDVENIPDFMANKAGVLLEGGDALFVDNAQGFIRLNLAMPRAILQKGFDRIVKAVREHIA